MTVFTVKLRLVFILVPVEVLVPLYATLSEREVSESLVLRDRERGQNRTMWPEEKTQLSHRVQVATAVSPECGLQPRAEMWIAVEYL